MLMTVNLRDFEAKTACIALVLARPQWNEQFGVMTPPVRRDRRRLIRLIEICGVIIFEPMSPWRLSYILDQRVERIRPNGRRQPWHPTDAWIRRFLGSPYIQWIPSLSWYPEELRPDGRPPPGWSVVDWPNQLHFTDWT